MLKRRLNLKVSSDVAELTKINQSQPYAAYILRVWPVNGSVTKYLVRVHKWSGRTNYVEHKWSPRTIYVVISGPVKTQMVRVDKQ